MTQKEPLKNKKILIVDDEPDLREVIREECELRGLHVIEAHNGDTALDTYYKNPVDIIITDLRMPDGSGVELLAKLREKNPVLPIVFLITGFSDLSEEQAFDMGANLVLSKPIDFNQLFLAMEKMFLPEEQRWIKRTERVDAQFDIELAIQGEEAIHSKTINIGRGGFFIHIEDALPKKNTEIRFNILLPASFPVQTLKGAGIVKWVRTESNASGSRGCGVEFQELENESLKSVLDFLKTTSTKAFIPQG